MANETITTLNMTLLLRRAAFVDSCVLQAGEPGYHTTTKEFKIGDGTTTWKDLPIANKTQIDAIVSAAIAAHAAGYYTKGEIDEIKLALQQATAQVASDLSAEVTARTSADTELQNQIDTKLATETFNTWKDTHENDHAGTATEITAEITGAVNGEKTLREAADKDITDTLGTGFDKGDNTVAKKIAAAETAAKSHAETKASDAQAAAIAEAEAKDAARATAAAEALSSAKSELEGKITSGDTTTLGTAKDYTDEKVAAEAKLRSDADDALDGRLDTVEAKLNNVSNVMDFVGAGAALPAAETSQKGDVFVINSGDDAGKEFVFDGTNWVEFGFATANESAIADLQSRMGVAEGEIDQAQVDIIALGTNKLNVSVYNAYIEGKAMSDAELKSYADGKASTAKSEAITEAGNLDTALHTTISAEIDADIKTAIDAEVTRSNAKAKELADAAQSAAEATAEAKDAARYTTVTNDIATAKQEAIDAAKEYTDAREIEIKKYADQAETDAVATAKSYTDGREVEIKKYADQAEADAIAAAKEYTDDQDAATLTAAKAYADEKVAGAVTKVTAGTDIVVTPAGGTGDVTVSHQDYSTGTFTKTPDSLTKSNDTYFFKAINVSNGHVTGGEMKSLAEALSAMTFIFDGGTSATTVTPAE